MEGAQIEPQVSAMLKRLGVSPKCFGYYYLKDAIQVATRFPTPGRITTVVYSCLAEKYATTTGAVEKDIRRAIESAFNKCAPNVIDDIFGSSYDLEKSRPTNAEFITTVAEYILLSSRK